MKTFLLLSGLILIGSNAMADDLADISGCKGAAVKSAIDYAKNYTGNKIKYSEGAVVKVEGRGRKMISTYDIGLEQCDSHGCGSLSFDVVVAGKKPNCNVLEVELTEEE